MKYELGDKVRIKKFIKKIDYGDMKFNAEQEYDEETDTDIAIKRIEKIECSEVGYICGLRNIIDSVKFGFREDEYIGSDLIWLSGTEVLKQVYIVATKMNGLRRVDIQDIEFIGVENEKI